MPLHRIALALVFVVGCSADPDAGVGDGGAVSPDAASGLDGASAGDALASDGAPASDGGPTTLSPRWVGRFTPTTAGKRCAWSGSFVEARFSGTKITLRVKDSGKNRFEITLDGQQTRLTPTANVDTYVLGDGLAPGEHEVRVLKDTEASVGATELLALELGAGGQFLPIAVPSRRIEVIGDSISAGYGDLGLGPNCNFSVDTESFRETYASDLGRRYGADVMGIAWSGIGVYRNYGGGMTNTMPTLYPRTLPSVTTSTWSFPSWVPDVVLLNLGTNDFTNTSPPEAPFEAAYEAFVTTIRKSYPSAFIFAITGGPMLLGTASQNERTWVKSVITKLTTAGDKKLDVIALPAQTGSHGGIGCDWHPSVGEHAFIADQIALKVGPALGW